MFAVVDAVVFAVLCFGDSILHLLCSRNTEKRDLIYFVSLKITFSSIALHLVYRFVCLRFRSFFLFVYICCECELPPVISLFFLARFVSTASVFVSTFLYLSLFRSYVCVDD